MRGTSRIIKITCSLFFFFILLTCLNSTNRIEDLGKGLVFSEVYLNEKEPEKSWIEIYNPCYQTLTLDRFRYSHLKSLSQLPYHIAKQGGIKIYANDYLILCANKKVFTSQWGQKRLVSEVEAVSWFADGGFAALVTKEIEETGYDAFKYGNKERTLHIEEEFGNCIVPFSCRDKSYSRKMYRLIPENEFLDFFESEPTPGLPNIIR